MKCNKAPRADAIIAKMVSADEKELNKLYVINIINSINLYNSIINCLPLKNSQDLGKLGKSSLWTEKT